MSRMVWVRHGQASFLSEDYDILSPLGRQQAQQLGQYWLRQGICFDECYCGPRRRHRETAEEVWQCYRQAGLDWPEIKPLPEFDEHQVDRLIFEAAPALAVQSDDLRALWSDFVEARSQIDKHRCFQRLFEAVAELWQRGEVEGVEPWQAFQTRVHQGVDQLLGQAGRGRRVLVVTSVGPIAVAVQRAVRCPDEVALQTGWRIWNASLTEFVFSANRFTLDVFNSVPHLDEVCRTYR